MPTNWKKLRALIILVLARAVLAHAAGPATPPPTVAFCDLMGNPQAFDGQWIQVRGHISLAPEDFSLHEPGCDRPLTRNIWLSYGGDEETPTTYCCGDHSRPKGQDISIRGRTISLVRDSAMQDFIARVSARRKRRVNGEPCSGAECNLYQVSAGIVGFFVAAPANAGNSAIGYGHMGCCHQLVIYKVFDVKAERTAVPDDDASFTCVKQSWQAEPPAATSSLLDPHVANKKFLAQQMRQRGDRALVEAMQNTLSKNTDSTGTLVWTSPDLLTTYSVPLPHSASAKKSAPSSAHAATVTVTRERCVPLPESSVQH